MKQYQEGNQMTELQNQLNTLDTNEKTKGITLSNGEVVAIPKLDVGKTLGLARVIAGDGFALWRKAQGLFKEVNQKDDFGNDIMGEDGQPLTEIVEPEAEEMFAFVVENLGDDLLPKVLGILFGMTPEKVDSLELYDAIELLAGLVEANDLKKTFLAVKKLTEKLIPRQTNEPIQTPMADA